MNDVPIQSLLHYNPKVGCMITMRGADSGLSFTASMCC